MRSVYAVIMAGGRGERFWPLSTEEKPKPFVPLVSPRTLLQETVDRLQPLIPPERILVAIGEAHRTLAASQLPGIPPENLIVEPLGRDTAACLGWSALHLERRDPDAIMLALPADHFISDSECFRRAIRSAADQLPGSTGAVFGIVPDRPETGYGYIRAEKPAVPADAWPVVRFVEKPDAATAAAYIKTGRYFWNSGMFLWRVRTLLELFERHMPDTCARLNQLRPFVGRADRPDQVREVFSSIGRVSIDYGVLEKASGLRMIPAGFGWDDIGNWGSLGRTLDADAAGNVARGSSVTVESGDCLLYSDAGTIAAFGVRGLVVVQARGRVLVCPRDRAADLKKLVSALPQETK
jgi:mannose-1-phosphate guanylyltransferase